METSVLLKISNLIVKDVLQPPSTVRKTQSKSTDKPSKSVSEGFSRQFSEASFDSFVQVNKDEAKLQGNFQEQLNQKIQFLMKYDFFSCCPAKVLMPIALNMQQVNFAYGDYLQREGEIPRGLFLIKSGICNIARTRILSREHKPEQVPGAKKLVLDKNKFFYKFNYDNTLLNGPKSFRKAYQNDRVFVNESGKQLTNEIQYEDL